MIGNPFISFQADHVRIVSCFTKDGQFFGCRHHVEQYRGHNGMNDVIWVESEKLLPSFWEEIIITLAEGQQAYQDELKRLYIEFPESKDEKLVIHVFGVSDYYLDD